jgi:hypothetical protein
MRCFESDADGLSNSQYAIVYALDSVNIFGKNDTNKMINAGMVDIQPSEVVMGFFDENLFNSVF